MASESILENYLKNLKSQISPLAVLKVNEEKFNIVLYNGLATHIMVPLKQNEKVPEKEKITLKLLLTNQTFSVNEIKKLDISDNQSMLIFNDQKYRKILIDNILKIKENLTISDIKQNFVDLYQKLMKEEKEKDLNS